MSYSGHFVADGVDLYDEYGLVLTDEFDLGFPEPKTHYVDIPGGNGSIDLTEVLTEDVVYDNREQSFTFAATDIEDIGTFMTSVRNRFHGQQVNYTLVEDPGYYYTGRLSVESVERVGFEEVGADWLITLVSTAEPYKTKGTYTYALNGTGGKWFEFESGRMPVHPLVESEVDFEVVWEGTTYYCQAGTAYRLHFCTFREGINRIYINSAKLYNVTWDDLNEGGQVERIWDGLLETTWDGIQRLLPYEDDPNAIVYLTYEWKDL